MLSWKQLQDEQREWSLKNFGPHPYWHAHLGMIEEAGELAHAHLKGIQGIRHTPEEIRAMKIDAVADWFIFLADLCTQKGISLSDLVIRATINPCVNSYEALKDLAGATAGGWVQLAVDGMITYCKFEEIDWQQAAFTTWETVQQRDWTKK